MLRIFGCFLLVQPVEIKAEGRLGQGRLWIADQTLMSLKYRFFVFLNLLKKHANIFNMIKTGLAYGELSSTVLRRIRAKGASWAFTPSDFADLGDPRSIGMVLTRLSRRGVIRRVRRGVYETPRQHPILGTVGAGTDAVAQAIGRRDALKFLPSGAHAANALGLSTQVPARLAYGIVGRSRVQPAQGKSLVIFRQRSPKAMALAGRASGWLAEALRNIGRVHVTTDRLKSLRARLGPKEKKQLLEDLRYVPAWMRPFFRELANDDDVSVS